MSKLPQIKPERVIRALLKAGFYIHHQRGSHVVLKHPRDSIKRVVVPHHNKDLKKAVLKDILNKSNISIEEFMKLML